MLSLSTILSHYLLIFNTFKPKKQQSILQYYIMCPYGDNEGKTTVNLYRLLV